MNIALAKGLIDSVQEKSPAILTAPFIIGVIPLINIFGWAFAKILPSSKVMPSCYSMVAIKKPIQSDKLIPIIFTHRVKREV